MATHASPRHERVRSLTNESRWWHKVGFVYAVLGTLGVGIGLPLSLVHGEEIYGVPLTAFGIVFLIAASRSHDGGDAFLDLSFKEFDKS